MSWQVVDEPFSTAWRVEWGHKGHPRRGASFVGDDRESRARDELEERKTGYMGSGEWERVA